MMKLSAAVVGALLATGGAAQALPSLGGDVPAPAAAPAAPVAPPAPAPAAAPAPATRAPVPLDRTFDEPPALGGGGGEKYVGVIPGPNARNPLPPAKKAPPHLIWSGFKSGDGGGSQVFFQTNLPVTYEVVPASGDKPRELSVFLRNCRIHMRNNQRNLDTRFFATPVQGVSARQRRKDVELRIVLKEPSSPTPRTEPGPDGTQFVVLEFPAGQPAAVETAAPSEN
jgi:hypothetical protein